MRRTALALTAALGAVLTAEGPAPAQEAADADARVLALLEEDLDALMERWPGWASSRGDRRFDDRLADVRPEAHRAWVAACRERLARIEGVDRAALSPARRVDAELLTFELEQRIARARFREWLAPIDQLGGPQRSLPQLPERLSFTTRAHLADYAARLEAVPAYLEQVTANMERGLEAGITPPRRTVTGAVDQALEQATRELAESPGEHPMFAPFRDLPEDDALRARARAAVAEGVIPAFRRLGEFLRDTYVPACRQTIAATERPDGAAYYAFQLQEYTTRETSAAAVHERGLAEVARIRSDMLATIRRSGFQPEHDSGEVELEGDARFRAFVRHLRTAPRFYCETAEELLRGYRDLAKRIDAHLPSLFGRLPRNTYGVKRMPEFIAPSSPTAYYYSGSLENGKPGWFVANTHELDQRPRYEMVPLTLHEAVPGHHLQISLAREMDDLPEWRTTCHYTVFVEGWALYAERLGLEMGDGPRGLYADPYDDFGRLSYEMWRAMRLVVDTGIHALGWSRERAVEYMLEHSALTRKNVENEVDRYIAWPGQAVAYKTGELAIRALRRRAEERLGARFDVRAFHDAVLGRGAVPLDLLEEQVEAWIASVE